MNNCTKKMVAILTYTPVSLLQTLVRGIAPQLKKYKKHPSDTIKVG